MGSKISDHEDSSSSSTPLCITSNMGSPIPDREDSSSSSTPLCITSYREVKKTQWASIVIASVLTFLRTLQLTLYFSSLWPYLMELDSDITETFFGVNSAVYNLAQAVMCFTFGYLSNRLRQSKGLILLGVTIVIAGNIMYLLVPTMLFPPRWTIILSSLITGLGGGVITVLRNVSTIASTEKDRSRAISINMGALTLGIILGPGLQAIYVPFGYPGTKLIGSLYLNMYTAPVITGLLLNLLSVFLVVTFYKESSVGIAPKPDKEDNNECRKLPPYDKLAVFVCICTQFAMMFVIANMENVGPAYSMTMFSWTKKEMLKYNSVMHAAYAGVGTIIYSLDFMLNLHAKINNRLVCIFSLIGFIIFQLVTFSWWFLPGELTYNERVVLEDGTAKETIEAVGCRPSYSWCKEVTPVDMWVYMGAYVVIIGISFSLLQIVINTLFSMIIGPRNQGTLTGLLMLTGCVARIVGPLVVTSLFHRYGPRPVWLLEICVSAACVLLWLVSYKRMVPLRLERN